MLVAQFNEKLVVETQKTEEMFGDKVNQVTNLVTELQSLCARLDEKAAKLSASSKLTISNLDLYRRNFVSKVPTYKLKIENMWGEAIREGNAAGDVGLNSCRKLPGHSNQENFLGLIGTLCILKSAIQGREQTNSPGFV